ncbi:hypothetical protein DESC_730012 [Desulfosarcina cetonica]|uniref:hypothetical protein n=1 Tax=Desulfosarcina cetonica TaxID=90730 RepID=UPI0006D09DB4|nr:hypothetical protein [Desulfosarcina cetonica]VTR69132.1 hypothetical protein DESC_730012 [Desulfosarcina cetonica]
MNRTEQMTMGFQSATAELNPTPPCVHRCTPCLPAIGESQLPRTLSFPRLDRTRGFQLRRGDVRRFLKIVCRAAVECLAMAGIILFAALATLLLGL